MTLHQHKTNFHKMRQVKEKENWKTVETVQMENEQVDMFVKYAINYEKMTYKVTPIITGAHGTDEDTFLIMAEAARAAAVECERLLREHLFETPGAAVQGDLFAQKIEIKAVKAA